MWGFLSGAALNTGLDVPVGRMVSPDMHLGVGLPDHRVALFLVLQGSSSGLYTDHYQFTPPPTVREPSAFSLLSPSGSVC